MRLRQVMARPRVFERHGKPLVAWLYWWGVETLVAGESLEAVVSGARFES